MSNVTSDELRREAKQIQLEIHNLNHALAARIATDTRLSLFALLVDHTQRDVPVWFASYDPNDLRIYLVEPYDVGTVQFIFGTPARPEIAPYKIEPAPLTVYDYTFTLRQRYQTSEGVMQERTQRIGPLTGALCSTRKEALAALADRLQEPSILKRDYSGAAHVKNPLCQPCHWFRVWQRYPDIPLPANLIRCGLQWQHEQLRELHDNRQRARDQDFHARNAELQRLADAVEDAQRQLTAWEQAHVPTKGTEDKP